MSCHESSFLKGTKVSSSFIDGIKKPAAYGNLKSKHFSLAPLNCRWEDNLSNNNGGRRAEPANVGRIGRGRGGRSGRAAADTTFVSATGDPVSGRRCYVCGDPSHFANVCTSRGMWVMSLNWAIFLSSSFFIDYGMEGQSCLFLIFILVESDTK